MATVTQPDAAQVSPTDHAVIQCAGLTKIFRDFWFRNRVRAVNNINLQVRRGEVFGLLGPNGSGKSTAIKMILGLLNPTAGRVAVFGKRSDDVTTKKQIGYLPEESYLYRFLNARETLEYYGRLFHQSRVVRKRRIDMLLEMVGLEAVQRRPIGEYSKGMQRRIGVAQALINDPQLLILDEPTTGLDPIGTRQIKDLVLELKRKGKTVLLCSHLLADVEDVCDRVAVMYGGMIQREGTVSELLTQQNMTTISTELLDTETINEIEAVLAKRGISIDRVEQPRQKLESLFLDIVHQAQAEGAATSGAVAGGAVAPFLKQQIRDSHFSEEVSAARMIDELVRDSGEKAEDVEGPEPTVAETADLSVIHGLTGTDDRLQVLTASGEAQSDVINEPTESPAAAAADHEADLSVIDALTDAGSPVASKAAPAGVASGPQVEHKANDELTDHEMAAEVFVPAPAVESQMMAAEVEDAQAVVEATEAVTDIEADTEAKNLDDPADRAGASRAPAPERKGGSGEEPDQAFLDALLDVPRDDEERADRK